MKRVFNTASEVSHLWANQVQDNARCRNARFDGTKFYSYSTVIADIHTNVRGDELVLICNDNYSMTTSKHKRYVAQAANHKDVLYVDLVSPDERGHDSNYCGFMERHAKLIDQASRARENKGYHLQQANSLLRSMTDYAQFFDIVWAMPAEVEGVDEIIAAATIKLKAKIANQDARNEVLSAKRAVLEIEQLEIWLAGGITQTRFARLALRIKNDEIQTSHGANIPLDHALKVWPVIYRAHILGRPFIPSQERAIHLGHYRFNSFQDDVLTVGCHRIPYSEIERMASQLGLLELA